MENGALKLDRVSTVGVPEDKPPAFAVEEIETDEGTIYTYKLPNMPEMRLPFTGGRKIYPFMAMGASLLSTAAVVAVWYSARGGRNTKKKT